MRKLLASVLLVSALAFAGCGETEYAAEWVDGPSWLAALPSRMEPGRYKDSCQDVDYREFACRVTETPASQVAEDEPVLKEYGLEEGAVKVETPYNDEDVRIEGTVADITGYMGDVSRITVHLTTDCDDPRPIAHVFWPDPLPAIYEGSEVIIWGRVVGPEEAGGKWAPMLTGYYLTCSKR